MAPRERATDAAEVPASAEAMQAAEDAGLHYVSDAAPGFRRRRAGRGFTYLRPDGTTLKDAAVRERIKALAIPPAWTDVWICADARGHLQATGRDQRGRKQYRYHPRWRATRDANKFDRLADFGAQLPELRRRIDEDLRLPGLPRDRVLALVVRLLDDTLVRVGNPEYAADNDTYGLTTLRRRHVALRSRRVTFEFTGKSGIEHEVQVQDPQLTRVVRRCHELGGKELFSYEAEDGALLSVSSNDVNAYLRETIGDDTSAKDFRTWGGTVIALEFLAACATREDSDRDADILAAIDAAAESLGNTRAVCRASYIHPAVPASYDTGVLLEHWNRARGTQRLRRGERATLAVLEDQANVQSGPARSPRSSSASRRAAA